MGSFISSPQLTYADGIIFIAKTRKLGHKEASHKVGLAPTASDTKARVLFFVPVCPLALAWVPQPLWVTFDSRECHAS